MRSPTAARFSTFSQRRRCMLRARRGLLFPGRLFCSHVHGASRRTKFPPQVGQPGSTAIAASDPRFVEWAATVQNLTRRATRHCGCQHRPRPASAWRTTPWGQTTAKSSSLGDGGQITVGVRALQFAMGLPAAGFRRFAENGFLSGHPLAFLELGFVRREQRRHELFSLPIRIRHANDNPSQRSRHVGRLEPQQSRGQVHRRLRHAVRFAGSRRRFSVARYRQRHPFRAESPTWWRNSSQSIVRLPRFRSAI